MAVFVEGLIGVIIFYIIILVIGLVAGRKKSSSADSQFLADRGLGLFVSSFTLSGKIVTEDDEHAVDKFVMSWQNFQAAMLYYRADFRLHARPWSSLKFLKLIVQFWLKISIKWNAIKMCLNITVIITNFKPNSKI